jgi:hypothetical protein
MDCFLKIWIAAFRSYALKYALLLSTPLKNFKEKELLMKKEVRAAGNL